MAIDSNNSYIFLKENTIICSMLWREVDFMRMFWISSIPFTWVLLCDFFLALKSHFFSIIIKKFRQEFIKKMSFNSLQVWLLARLIVSPFSNSKVLNRDSKYRKVTKKKKSARINSECSEVINVRWLISTINTGVIALAFLLWYHNVMHNLPSLQRSVGGPLGRLGGWKLRPAEWLEQRSIIKVNSHGIATIWRWNGMEKCMNLVAAAE